MPPQEVRSIGTDAANCFEDLSGLIPKAAKMSIPENPYNVLIGACSNNPALIQKAYETHRTTRNAQQRTKLLSPDQPARLIDHILQELEHVRGTPIPELSGAPKRTPAEIDPRNCLVFWARPTRTIMDLVAGIQEKLRLLSPDIWLMPLPNLHLTVLEITHSQTSATTAALVEQLDPHLQELVNLPWTRRATLVKPILSYDAAALAVSFVPADKNGETYTYHHLRRDFYERVKETGVGVESRYVVPSAHITIARFVTAGNLEREEWVRGVEEIGKWVKEAGEGVRWVVGEERGIEFRSGRLWYGEGFSVAVGEGF